MRLAWNCAFAAWHDDEPIARTDARSADGASKRAKSRATAIEQRDLMAERFEYNQQQIESAMESCALRYFGESSSALVGQPAPAARLAADASERRNGPGHVAIEHGYAM
jgi:hypothetical protein